MNNILEKIAKKRRCLSHKSYVRGVMENVDWVFDVSTGNWIAQEAIEEVKDTGRKSARELQARKVEFFERFVNSLK